MAFLFDNTAMHIVLCHTTGMHWIIAWSLQHRTGLTYESQIKKNRQLVFFGVLSAVMSVLRFGGDKHLPIKYVLLGFESENSRPPFSSFSEPILVQIQTKEVDLCQ